MTAAVSIQLEDDAIGRRLVSAATDCFMRDGYAGTSTASIAREAKTSKRALYERFPNKEALFEFVMHEICSRAANESPRPPLDPGSRPELEDLLRWYGLAVVDRFAMRETRSIFIAAVSAIPDAPNVIEIFWNEGPGQAADAIAKALSAARKAGDIGPLKPGKEARWFIMECAGPVVLGQLFDGDTGVTRRQLDEHVNGVVRRFMQRLQA